MSNPDSALYLIHALTPLHIGTEGGLGAIDLPTTREAHTGYPVVPGSSVKGVLRDAAQTRWTSKDPRRSHEKVREVFGPDSDTAGDFRGALTLTDARLLLLPVRSLAGTFAWVTCKQVLDRLAGDLSPQERAVFAAVSAPADVDRAWVPRIAEDKEGPASSVAFAGKALLDDYVLQAQASKPVAQLAATLAGWIWRDDAEARRYFQARLLVVHDDLFAFYTRNGLEIRWRVPIDDETGTARASGPWSEEHLPAESVLVGVAQGRMTRYFRRPVGSEEEKQARDHDGRLDERTVQGNEALSTLRSLLTDRPRIRVGGKSSVGLGRARFVLV